ncbi:uncharacterized protein L199_008268 [Kwoniella botswanensis]|uniref:uncharacterized protein n=1 Tax=Kwoniella botswanensis TaxID=1268659 RepID=UPI00315D7981
MANHQAYLDWMYLWILSCYAGHSRGITILLKASLKNIPVIGWGMIMGGGSRQSHPCAHSTWTSSAIWRRGSFGNFRVASTQDAFSYMVAHIPGRNHCYPGVPYGKYPQDW